MPTYLFQKAVSMTETQFGMDFESLRDLHTIEKGDPVTWLREQAEQLRKDSPNKILNDGMRTKRLLPGRMYMMRYNPINKQTLPYYDMFPVFFCMDVQDKYFSGLNLHYLPPLYRAELMDALYPFVIAPQTKGVDIGTTIRTRLSPRVDYEFMKKRRPMMSFKPTWKRYNKKAVIGNFMYVPPVAWDSVMMLPIQRFRKAGINKVWRDSLMDRKRIRK
jgi:hypothetical protein|tara:strand:- start:3891 stop:4544 length:654 start_codon:yes stop_codon:yes gene_type:complete